MASIAAGRVGVLTFLYDGHNEWQHGKLRDVIARMDELGYACYLAGGCQACVWPNEQVGCHRMICSYHWLGCRQADCRRLLIALDGLLAAQL